jgi:hypothetical protein
VVDLLHRYHREPWQVVVVVVALLKEEWGLGMVDLLREEGVAMLERAWGGWGVS